MELASGDKGEAEPVGAAPAKGPAALSKTAGRICVSQCMKQCVRWEAGVPIAISRDLASDGRTSAAHHCGPGGAAATR